MIFNESMSIWILAILLLVILTLAGWRQGGIRAAFTFGGIFFGVLLAGLAGKIFNLILPHVISSPITAWALAPICGFLLVSIIFTIIGFEVHRRVEIYYKHQAGELRQAMWKRLNVRLGICIGVLNGALYFVLISFVFFNLAYLTTQVAVAENQSFSIRTVNALGHDMQSSGISRVAAGVGTLPPLYYQLADIAGFLMQNPKAGQRLADYPGLTSLWQRDEMQALVNDNTLTNALASGATVGQILNEPPVQDFLKNKDLSLQAEQIFQTNMDDLKAYLQTGQSAKFNDNLIGQWTPNISVTLAWWRQGKPNISGKEMAEIRNLWTPAYAQTVMIVTGDHQLFVKNFPTSLKYELVDKKPVAKFDLQNWKGDWSNDDGSNYTLHVTVDGTDKYMPAKADAFRLSAKNGKDTLIFDRAD